uniref:Uncharacterized protein n=1 Tax=Ixodes ricinus TaxID=34613 RepID=A0A6B0TQT0_IXORI
MCGFGSHRAVSVCFVCFLCRPRGLFARGIAPLLLFLFLYTTRLSRKGGLMLREQQVYLQHSWWGGVK